MQNNNKNNNEELMKLFFEKSSEAMMISDKNNHIIRVNKAFETITGYSEKEVLGKKPSFLKSGNHDEKFYDDLWNHLLEHGSWIGEIWDKRKDGSIYPKSLSINTITNEKGEVEYFTAFFSEISKIKQANQHLNFLLKKDYLTGLDNRLSLSFLLEEDISKEETFGLLFLDLDNFKYINDTLGHSIGDTLLISVSNRLKHIIGKHDTVARIGGDEFVIVVRDVKNKEDIEDMANNVLAGLAPPFEIFNHEIKEGLFITPSIGISVFPQDGNTVDDLLKHADLAMYQVKNTGKNYYHFFNTNLVEDNAERFDLFSLEHQLRLILKNTIHPDKSIYAACGNIVPYFQPIYDISGDHYEIVGYEVLTRWEHPEKGLIPPSKFIPIVENFELMNPFFFHLFYQSFNFLKHIRKKLYFNISPNQLSDLEFLNSLMATLEKVNYNVTDYGIDYNIIDYIGLEFTENALIYQEAKIIDKLHELSNLGLELIIDDFGTGYSSLSYLSKLPIHKIKIDGSFVKEINKLEKNNKIISSIILLCQNLDIHVVSECVETLEQLEWLKNSGCNLIQGYYLGRPQPYRIESQK